MGVPNLTLGERERFFQQSLILRLACAARECNAGMTVLLDEFSNFCLDNVGRDRLALMRGRRSMAFRTTRSEKLDLRLTRQAKLVLKAAAAASRRSVSEFVVESALAKADEALADRRSFGLSSTQWKTFLAALDAPPRPLPRLERLLKEPGFFDPDHRP